MVRHDQLGIQRLRLFNGFKCNIENGKDPAHFALRKAAEQPDVVKVELERGWNALFQIARYFTYCRHNILSSIR